MTTRTDSLDAVMRAWLDEGLDTAPERAVGAALTQINHTRQRRELSVIRRIPLMDATHPRPRPAWQIGAVVAVAAVALTVTVAAMAQLLPQVGSSHRAPTVGEMVIGLPIPANARQTGRVAGDEVRLTLFDATQARAFANLRGFTDAAAVTYAGTSTGHRYTAAAISYPSAGAAASALADLDGTTGDFWRPENSPLTDAHLPAGRDEGFERSGTWVAFGGTSANADNRAGSLLVWRVNDLLFVAVGIDWDTTGTAEAQAALEAGTMSLADRMTERTR